MTSRTGIGVEAVFIKIPYLLIHINGEKMTNLRPYVMQKAKLKPLVGMIATAVLSVALTAPFAANAAQPYGKAAVFSNPTPIQINDTCANPDQPDCAALVDYYNPELEPAGDDGITEQPPQVPVVVATPSTIVVPEDAFRNDAVISDISVTIHDIHHDYLNDVDILLVAPNGSWVMLASNVSSAGATPEGDVLGIKAEGLNWRFHDSAALPLPRSVRDDGRLSGRTSSPLYNVIYDEWVGVWTDTSLRTFKPSDYDNSPDTDHFPDGVTGLNTFNSPTNSVGLTTSTVLGTVDAANPDTFKKVLNGPKLSNLHGISPAGVWKLIVADDYFWFDGEIKGGWSLEITTERDKRNRATR
jgi:subtilisin-like proprotein convertase family protein